MCKISEKEFGDHMRYFISALFFLIFASAAFASSPAGLWKTIDDKTGDPKALVRVTDVAGTVSGRIEKILNPKAPKNEVCSQCRDERKDKPVLGMTILKDLKPDGTDEWSDGSVLDPKNGKVYRASIRLKDGGKKLELRGYLGPFYRTQVWLRAD